MNNLLVLRFFSLEIVSELASFVTYFKVKGRNNDGQKIKEIQIRS